MESELIRKLREATRPYDLMEPEPNPRFLKPGEKPEDFTFTWQIRRSKPDGV